MKMRQSTSPSNIQKAWQHKVYDIDSKQIPVGSLFATCTKDDKLVLVVFIRHFYCGNCQEFLRRLASSLLPESESTNLKVVIIGCGSPTFIKSYRTLTNCPDEWPIYADPSTKLYKLLGMQRSLSLGPRDPEYIQQSLVAGAIKSVVQAMKRIPQGDLLAAGGWSVNGGEYLFRRVEGTDSPADVTSWEVVWSHQMQNSRDHTEVEDLRRRLYLIHEDSDQQSDSSELTLSEKSDNINPRKSFRRSLSDRGRDLFQRAGKIGRPSSSLTRNSVIS